MRLNAGPEVTQTTAWILGRNLALSVALATVFAGCGSHSDSTPAQSPAKTITRKVVNPADDTSRMVSAVAASKPSTLPVQLKFDLHDRPDIGQPLEVDLAIVPMSASVDRVSGRVEGDEGLEIVDGAQIPAADRPVEGSPIRQSVKVLPKQEGIFTVHAQVTVDAGGQTSTETYAIPVMAAGDAGAPAIAATAPARVGDAAGHATAPAGTAAAQ